VLVDLLSSRWTVSVDWHAGSHTSSWQNTRSTTWGITTNYQLW